VKSHARDVKPNKLINEKSPYLLQHAYNPVDWHPWNEETFAKAKSENKPIFLSIGYSTCYWCHVMEREVFENPEIAEMMNDYFINIKVDREERPDIDRIYMTALQAMTGSGGWPMSMFLTTELKPFYGATYIPPKAKYGRAGFEDVITQIHQLWTEKKGEIIDSSNKILGILKKSVEEKDKKFTAILPGTEIFDKAFSQVHSIYDEEYGGFGSNNKFPRPVVFDFLLNYHYYTKQFDALDMVTFSLKKMYEGGMYDHLGGGFHRYSVDSVWRVPHFEKMLYDQAQLIITYTDTFLASGNEYFKKVAEDTLKYVLRDLSHPEGGFYSAEDAESFIDKTKSEKREGEFYLWQRSEIEGILEKEKADIFSYYYGVEAHGNTISDPHEVFGTKNVLYIAHDVYETAKKFNKTPEEIEKIIEESKQQLLEERNKRPRPHLDDKILTSWNGLMISALAKAYRATGKELYLNSAEKAAGFIMEKLITGDVKLLHRYRDGESAIAGNLDDYSYFIQALMDLYESAFNIDYLKKAIDLNNEAIRLFYDESNGGFFDTEGEKTDIILKTKDIYDGAEPSGNSVQILNQLRLAIFTGSKTYNEIAEKSLKLFANDMEKMPFSSPAMLNSLSFMIRSPKEIILNGDLSSDKVKDFLKAIYSVYIPNSVIIHASDEMVNILEFLNNIVQNKKEEAVYICENYMCDLPFKNVEELEKKLK
jgi:uncharacterized protein YyaL (SSP411 family)